MLDMNNIPMGKIIEMELDTGFMLADIFEEEEGKENPWGKLAFAYLKALSAGKKVTWQQMKEMSSNDVMALAPVEDDADPKEVSDSNN